MTLDDLERANALYSYCRKDASFGTHHKNFNEDRPILSATKNVVQWLFLAQSSGIRFMGIFAEVPREGGVKRQWGCRERLFSAFSLAIFSDTLEMSLFWGQRYYTAIRSTSSAFQWSQNAWPCLTFNGYFALNCFLRRFGWLRPCDFRKIIAWKLMKTDTSQIFGRVSGNVRFVRIFARVL